MLTFVHPRVDRVHLGFGRIVASEIELLNTSVHKYGVMRRNGGQSGTECGPRVHPAVPSPPPLPRQLLELLQDDLGPGHYIAAVVPCGGVIVPVWQDVLKT